MRALRVLFLVMVVGILGAATVTLASPSAAGGPTSVMLMNPLTGRGAALHTSDGRYGLLATMVGAFDTGPSSGGRAPDAAERDAIMRTPSISATWLIHDVSVWRVDQIYLDAPGGPWLASRTNISGTGAVWDAEPVLHRPARSKELAPLLDQLGLGSSATSLVPDDAAATAPPTPPAPTGPGAAVPLWGLAGVAVGAGLVLGIGRVRRRPTRGTATGDIEADLDVPVGSGSSA